MFSLDSEGFGKHLNDSHDPERDTAVPEKDPADQKKHRVFARIMQQQVRLQSLIGDWMRNWMSSRFLNLKMI